MTSAHFIYIPAVLLLGIVIGWILGSRAAADAFAMQARRDALRAQRATSNSQSPTSKSQPPTADSQLPTSNAQPPVSDSRRTPKSVD